MVKVLAGVVFTHRLHAKHVLKKQARICIWDFVVCNIPQLIPCEGENT